MQMAQPDSHSSCRDLALSVENVVQIQDWWMTQQEWPRPKLEMIINGFNVSRHFPDSTKQMCSIHNLLPSPSPSFHVCVCKLKYYCRRHLFLSSCCHICHILYIRGGPTSVCTV